METRPAATPRAGANATPSTGARSAPPSAETAAPRTGGDPAPPSGEDASPELAPITLEGWYVLHQLYRVDWRLVNALAPEGIDAVTAAIGRLAERWSAVESGWSGLYTMVGSGVDLMLLHFREDFEGLAEARHQIARSTLGDILEMDQEYLSVVELGLYGLTAELAVEVDPGDRDAWRAAVESRLAEERAKSFVQRRLFPTQPDDLPYVCYYPMDKRRTPGGNWYALELEERARMMQAHGSVGRQYAGRISQVISGSIGLADWEWAVTLFAGDPTDFKAVVTEMRYDEASALYADFGQFFVGKRMSPAAIGALMAEDA